MSLKGELRTKAEPSKKGGRWLLLILILIIVILGLALTALFSVFQTAHLLMSLPAKPFNHIGAHLMPPCDEISFRSQRSDILLSGWFFKSRAASRGNVILIHNNGDNRLQFDLQTAELYRFLNEEDFNVLSFDLRHSGKSDGLQSAYGLSEYKDVLAAMIAAERLSGDKRMLLYGFGSGVTAALLAWNELPIEAPDEKALAADPELPNLCRKDVQALLLDTPAASVFDYIRVDMNPEGFMNQHLYWPFLPEAVRLASGAGQLTNLIPLASQIQSPMFIIRNLPEQRIPQHSIDAFINERLRLNGEMTLVSEIAKAGHISAFTEDQESYLQSLKSFLDRWIEYPPASE